MHDRKWADAYSQLPHLAEIRPGRARRVTWIGQIRSNLNLFPQRKAKHKMISITG
jgi:hypothetical protein